MRLIDAKTYQLVEYIGQVVPPYVILSHTWGDEEVTFKDFETTDWLTRGDKKDGRDKILGCCAAASAEDFGFVWADTCCIDKSSSAELSEAVNSMFRWYQDAAICFAYLSDVDGTQNPKAMNSDFMRSKWFTRGWTLQELLAPSEVVFFGRDWIEIGNKGMLHTAITRITRISSDALLFQKFSRCSVAQRMSWAASRNTTRLEDEAYCLMGLFDVNMPLIYGEGRKAFLRLQEEIMKRTDDESIFAWSDLGDSPWPLPSGLLATSPRNFKDSWATESITSQGIGPELRLLRMIAGHRSSFEHIGQIFRVRPPFIGPLKAMALASHSDSLLESLSDVILTSDQRIPNELDSRWRVFSGMVILVPLMCAINGHSIGLLLGSRSELEEDSTLERWHLPSLVITDRFFEISRRQSIQSKMTDCYVSSSSQNNLKYSGIIIGSEIRIAKLMEVGYAALVEQSSEWTFHEKLKKVITLNTWGDQACLILFQHQSEAYVDFFLKTDSRSSLIGLLRGSPPSVAFHECWTVKMHDRSSAAIRIAPSGNQFIVIRRRSLARVRYLSLSIETYESCPSSASLSSVSEQLDDGLDELNMRLQERRWTIALERLLNQNSMTAGRKA